MNTSRQLCTFVLQGRYFGVDVRSVQEVMRKHDITRVPLAPPHVRGLINLRGEIVTSLDLRIALAYGDRLSLEDPMNVVLRTETGAVALIVDEIEEVIEVDDSMFEPAPERLRGMAQRIIRGVFKIEHRLMLELDPRETIRAAAARPSALSNAE